MPLLSISASFILDGEPANLRNPSLLPGYLSRVEPLAYMQGYLAHKKTPPPLEDHHKSPGMVIL